MVTAEQFAAVLQTHPHIRIADAARAVGLSKARVYQREDLKALAQAHVAAERKPRNAARQLGCHSLALSHAILDRLDAYRAIMARRLGPARASRSAAVRAILAAALVGPLPEPLPAEGDVVVLDLGDVWDKVAAVIGDGTPSSVAAAIRGILAASQVPENTGARKKSRRST
jgi:hypothetical protein